MTSEGPEADAKRCPVCGRGVLVDLGFDADPPWRSGGPAAAAGRTTGGTLLLRS